MNKIFIKPYQSHLGNVLIGVYDHQLCLLDWQYRKQRVAIDHRITKYLDASYIFEDHPLHQKVIEQLQEYFCKKRKQFEIPLLLTGSAFQQTVWNELMKIPYGHTISYLTLSRKLNHEKAIRAVASANGANALSILIPCHRVIASNGELKGYAGGLTVKKKLLQIEGALNRGQLNLF
ncbi:methylated-DNA--[protein]-cysteine S-methyltransferase [Nonlabens ulvanivorans]|uniref:methylated-DNA--[protein]-cysteine S-methyltransferase n=1 Tax=Nonlabens ulvanivorans TaxID=906888 RepID=UPI002943901C|nr:methylated-DNA--[protein]-cysteine S-methyltransferase [Nonlabens ulvanivorans]WOI23694.1 methylated-DNA--[protein]-cysteine S-methyltransferase [Nonlabens ulvanivorans]